MSDVLKPNGWTLYEDLAKQPVLVEGLNEDLFFAAARSIVQGDVEEIPVHGFRSIEPTIHMLSILVNEVGAMDQEKFKFNHRATHLVGGPIYGNAILVATVQYPEDGGLTWGRITPAIPSLEGLYNTIFTAGAGYLREASQRSGIVPLFGG